MELVSIGKFVATHGIKGHLVLVHALGAATALPGLRALMVSSANTGSLPYFLIEGKSRTANESLVLLEEIDSKEKATRLINKTVAIPKADFDRLVSRHSPLGIIGFTVVSNGEKIGEIEDVVEQPHQTIAYLDVQGKEVLIPLHKETVQHIDRAKKEIAVVLPEGLLDIYLQ